MQRIISSFQLLIGWIRDNYADYPVVKFYVQYQLLTWLVHLIIISLVSFFHLILNHNLGTIGEWINERGWQLILVTKLLSFYVIFQFHAINYNLYFRLKSYIQSSYKSPSVEFLIMSLFFILGVMSIGIPEWNEQFIFNLSGWGLTFLGNLVFWGTDLLVIIFAKVKSKIFSLQNHWTLFGLSIIFQIGVYTTFQYEISTPHMMYGGIFCLILTMSALHRDNWNLPYFFIATVLVPFFIVFGLDPVWSHHYSPFRFSRPIIDWEFILILSFLLGYYLFCKHIKVEYIYRE